MTLDLKSLELFVRIATVGAIGKAGSEFGLSRTSASQRIQALETDVGVQLFHRTTRKLSLTGEGEIFFEHARRILADVDDALSETQSGHGALKGEVRVASSSAFGRKFIAPYVSEFLSLHPGLSLYLSLSDVTVDLVDGGFDMAIRLGALAPSSLKARKLAASPRIIVAAPDYLARHQAPHCAEDLAGHNCLMRRDAGSWKLRGLDGEVRDFNATGSFASDSAEAITEVVLSGHGIARKCKWEIADHLESGRLVQLLPEYTVVPEWNIFAVRSPSHVVPTRVKAFTDFLKARFQGEKAFTES